MKTFLIIYFCFFMIVMSVFFIDRLIPFKPKGRFGKWWIKHIFEREND